MVSVTSNALLPFGENELFRNDDAFSQPIDITPPGVGVDWLVRT